MRVCSTGTDGFSVSAERLTVRASVLVIAEAKVAALAETGNFVSASELIQALMSDPAVVKSEAMLERWKGQLDCYQRREPLRE